MAGMGKQLKRRRGTREATSNSKIGEYKPDVVQSGRGREGNTT